MVKGIILKTVAISTLFLGASTMTAQDTTMKSKKTTECKTEDCDKGARKAFMESLNEEQKADYKAFQTFRKDKKKAFNATHTPEQKAIAEDKTLDKKAKKEKMKALLTDAQKAQKKADKEAIKAKKDAFTATLSDDQKALMEKLKGHKGKGKGKVKKAE